MKKISRQQKLILVAFSVIFLQLLFSTGKNAPAVHSATVPPPPSNIYGNIIYASEHFESLSLAIFGGPSCGTFKDPGTIAGHFTKDSACKYVYGPGAAAGTAVPGPQADICRLTGFVTENVECIGAAPIAPPPADSTCGPKKLIINYQARATPNCIHNTDGSAYLIYDYNWRTIDGTNEKFGIEYMNVLCSINSKDQTVEKKAISDAGGINPDQEVIINGTTTQSPAAKPDNPACPPPLPPPLSPPCADWKDGACIKIATSLFQGKNKSDGDISTDPGQFIVRILTIILSFTGGIALLLIISAGYKIMTSKGKPEAIQQGRDQLISAIVGLVFIIFSFVIFQLVVTDILKIPGIS